jgi:hypothetical protein
MGGGDVMENPNEYNDEEFSRWASALDTAVGGMWEAGATIEDINQAFRTGLENAGATEEV